MMGRSVFGASTSSEDISRMNEHLLRIMRMAGSVVVEPKTKDAGKQRGNQGGKKGVTCCINARKKRYEIPHERGGQGGDPPRT